jgi:hypothetical protein
MKICVKCNIGKELNEFPKDKKTIGGYGIYCKICRGNISSQLYHQNNKAAVKERKRLRYIANNKEIKAKNKIWRSANKEHLNAYQNKYSSEKYKTDDLYKLKTRMRKAIRKTFKINGFTKKTKTSLILGCSFDDLKLHIEKQFADWMTWDNHGIFTGEPNIGWDIDHIIPLATAKTEEDVIRLNHYTNLQPLCSYINRIIKRANI